MPLQPGLVTPSYSNRLFFAGSLLLPGALSMLGFDRLFPASANADIKIRAVWAALVLSISMYEAPTKFHADLVKKDSTKRGRFTALTIGRLMFWSMERLELLAAAAAFAIGTRNVGKSSSGVMQAFVEPYRNASTGMLVAFGILALQCLVLQPILDTQGKRLVEQHLLEQEMTTEQKKAAENSRISKTNGIVTHVVFGLLELVKAIALLSEQALWAVAVEKLAAGAGVP